MSRRDGTVDGGLDKGPPIPPEEFAKLQRLEEEEVENASSRLPAATDEEEEERVRRRTIYLERTTKGLKESVEELAGRIKAGIIPP